MKNTHGNVPVYAHRKIGTDGKRWEKDKMSLETVPTDESWGYVSLQQTSTFSRICETCEASLPELMGYVEARLPKKTRLALRQT